MEIAYTDNEAQKFLLKSEQYKKMKKKKKKSKEGQESCTPVTKWKPNKILLWCCRLPKKE